MTDREKLLELIAIGGFFSRSADAEKCADYLIANGVAPVVHGYWREYYRSALVRWKNGEPVWVDRAVYYCDGCSFGTIIKHNYCPRCGQKMDGGVSDG